MEICVFGYEGYYKPSSATFGKTRIDKNSNPKSHQGIDLFARVGTPVYACMDGMVISSEDQHNRGILIIKITDKQVEILKKMEKNDYTNLMSNEVKTYDGSTNKYNPDSNIFVFRYMHMSKVFVSKNKSVKCGDIIGETGIKNAYGNNYEGIRDPHLHFEIASSDAIKTGATGLNYRINPRVFINYKVPSIDLSNPIRIEFEQVKDYYTKGIIKNNIHKQHLDIAKEQFLEQVECVLNPAPYRIKQ